MNDLTQMGLDARWNAFWRRLSGLGYTMSEASTCFNEAVRRSRTGQESLEGALGELLYALQQESHKRSLETQKTGEPTLRVGLFEAAQTKQKQSRRAG